MENHSPLILTLRLDPKSFALFDGLRKRHFPPERNFIPAHLTLFHHLPGEKAEEISQNISEMTLKISVMKLRVPSLRSLGGGVAYEIQSSVLAKLRENFAQRWWTDLKPQDRQGFRAHITVQNKVSPQIAADLKRSLEEDFVPFEVLGEGLSLWFYRGGPWELVREFDFV